jgi:hypothetical protein
LFRQHILACDSCFPELTPDTSVADTSRQSRHSWLNSNPGRSNLSALGLRAIAARKQQHSDRMAGHLRANPEPMDFYSAFRAIRDVLASRPEIFVVNKRSQRGSSVNAHSKAGAGVPGCDLNPAGKPRSGVIRMVTILPESKFARLGPNKPSLARRYFCGIRSII